MDTKLTFKEIVDIMTKMEIDVQHFANEDFDYEELEKEVGKWDEVDHYGGSDCGSEWYSVYHFADHDVYLRVEGYYSSYEGTNFDGEDFQEVFPVEVKRLEYLPVRK
jgi:hypothetical protein